VPLTNWAENFFAPSANSNRQDALGRVRCCRQTGRQLFLGLRWTALFADGGQEVIWPEPPGLGRFRRGLADDSRREFFLAGSFANIGCKVFPRKPCSRLSKISKKILAGVVAGSFPAARRRSAADFFLQNHGRKAQRYWPPDFDMNETPINPERETRTHPTILSSGLSAGGRSGRVLVGLAALATLVAVFYLGGRLARQTRLGKLQTRTRSRRRGAGLETNTFRRRSRTTRIFSRPAPTFC